MGVDIERGETVALFSPKHTYVVQADGEVKNISGLGVIDTSRFISKPFGERVSIGGREYVLLPPLIDDRIKSISRSAQIITPKDAALIAYYCDVKSGDVILEAGTGSGALTILLANLVRPSGKVITYEVRRDFAKNAIKNIERAGLLDYVEVRNAEVGEDLEEKVDSIVLDLPAPWEVLDVCCDALKMGRVLATYLPNINQVERLYTALEEHNLLPLRTVELLEREWVVREGRSRPSFDMLAHTAFLTFSRKV